MEKNETPAPLCPNCSQPLPAADVIFCPHCGQKNSDGKVSMRDFLGRFFQHFTHLDNKFVRTVHDLFVPGKMTEVYFRGKRKRYPHPVQLFFIVMFFFLLAANHYVTQGEAIQLSITDKNEHAKKTSGGTFFPLLQEHAHSLRLRKLVDSLPPRLRDAHAREAIDSLLLSAHDTPLRELQQVLLSNDSADLAGKKAPYRDSIPPTERWRNWPALDSISVNLGFKNYLLSISDVATLSEEELLDKYQVEGYINRLLVKQAIKTLHAPTELMKFYAGSFSWTILMLVAVMSVFMLLLYRRQRRYYVEHFVFLMHWHSTVLLLLALLLTVRRFTDIKIVYPLVAIWICGSLFWALRRYYRTRIWSTLWRWLLFGLIYLLMFSLLFVLALLTALLLF